MRTFSPDVIRAASMKERGTAAIELALVFLIMLMLAIGTFEWGTGFADRISLASSVREGARVGAAAGIGHRERVVGR